MPEEFSRHGVRRAIKAVREGPVVLTDDGVEVAVLMSHSHYVTLLERFERLHLDDAAKGTNPPVSPIPEAPKT